MTPKFDKLTDLYLSEKLSSSEKKMLSLGAASLMAMPGTAYLGQKAGEALRSDPEPKVQKVDAPSPPKHHQSPDVKPPVLDSPMHTAAKAGKEFEPGREKVSQKTPPPRPAQVFPKGTPRGIRNNNPGNIEHNKNVTWQGSMGSDGRFITFRSPEYGIRALGKVLKTYNTKYKLDTVQGIINRWAPPHENDSSRYADFVAKSVGVKTTDKLKLFDKTGKIANKTRLHRLIKAIMTFENGRRHIDRHYNDKLISKGIKLI